jgi:TRAP-type uncharacterized transport system substrate-binding protein
VRLRDRIDLNALQALVLAILLVAATIFAVDRLRDLLPPDSLSFAAGRPGSAYFELAERYRRVLARDGIDLEIVETAGSVENAALLADPATGVMAGFLQGGVPLPPDTTVEALAATFLEPLWVMHTGALTDPADPSDWQDLRIAAGEPGSGTRFVVEALAGAVERGIGNHALLPVGGEAAAQALLDGEVDVALYVAPATAPNLQPLFAAPGVSISPIRDREALLRQLPFVQLADVPRSGFDYAAERPPEEVELIAMVGRLVARADLHPALVDRLVNAARTIHSGRDLITNENQFPSTAGVDMAVNAQAANLLADDKPSPLYRVLPYWIVAQVNSFALLLLPLLVILLPLMRIVPGLYQCRMRSRVYRRYPELLEIERDAYHVTDAPGIDKLERRLAAVEAYVLELLLPMGVREYAYTMRMHIDLERHRLDERRRAVADGRA